MAIMIIEGKADKVRSMAETLRNAQLMTGKGALILLRPSTRKGHEHDLRHQLEKIIDGMPLPEGAKVDGIDWKPDPMIIVPKAEEDLLPKLDDLVHGFIRHFGPISRMSV